MAIALRSDFDAVAVRSWARKSKDGPQARRLLTLAVIYEGTSRTEAAKIGGVTLQIVRDWVVRVVPETLRGVVGKRAVRISLGTKDPREAASRHPSVAVKVVSQWDALRAGPKPKPRIVA